MSKVWVPLQGPSGVRPKAVAVGAWQSPGYRGLDVPIIPDPTIEGGQAWVGLRCDDYVVIDCDSEEAYEFWLSIVNPPIDSPDGPRRWLYWSDGNTWVRKTPRGYHFIYRRTHHGPDAPAAGVWPHIDIRAGRTSQVVFYAPGYEDLTPPGFIKPFDPAWLPANFGKGQQDRSNDESWDEMPDGRGNNTMAAFAGAFRKQGMSPLTICKCLGAINRITMTEDPMPVEMIVEIARSVGRYTARPDVDIEVTE